MLEQARILAGAQYTEDAEIALVLEGAVERVGAIERQSVLARLHVLEAVRHLRLAHAEAELLVLVDEDVRVPVAEDGRVALFACGRREVGLEIDGDVLVDVTEDDQTCPPDQEARRPRRSSDRPGG